MPLLGLLLAKWSLPVLRVTSTSFSYCLDFLNGLAAHGTDVIWLDANDVTESFVYCVDGLASLILPAIKHDPCRRVWCNGRPRESS